MSDEEVETLIIGGGQAGLALSEQLSKRGLPHLVVERYRVVERWRTERWDGLHANGPAWSSCMAGFPFPGVEPDDFPTRDQIVDYFTTYAEAIAAPVRCGVAVTRLHRQDSGVGFRAETSQGAVVANNVVAATGPFQLPSYPGIVPPEAGIFQVHASGYRNPEQLPEGAVLVVGAGASGAQIADELLRADRQVFLSVGGHVRAPRRYRGHDLVWWMDALGMWDTPAENPPQAHIPLPVSGAYGGETVDFRRLAIRGLVPLGRVEGFRAGVMHFAQDLASSLAKGDMSYLSFLDAADAYAVRKGLKLPEEPAARIIEPDRPWIVDSFRKIDFREAGIGAIVWATGYTLDFSWLDVPVFDEHGWPMHNHGVTDVPGLYFLGLPWLSTRASSFIWGLGHDASRLADNIAARV
jgi:putative flavoprotein involved in K+ transport